MNRSELQAKLFQAGVPDDAYQLKGGLPNEVYCLTQVNNGWEVYYSERGNKSGLRAFETESEAYQYLYNLLVEQYQ